MKEELEGEQEVLDINKEHAWLLRDEVPSCAVPVFCVRGAVFSRDLTHLQQNRARLFDLSRRELGAPLRRGGGRFPWEGGPRGPRALKEGRHLLDVLH